MPPDAGEIELPDITDLSIEDRQQTLLGLSAHDIGRILHKLLKDSRQSEIGARLDAVTIYLLKRG